MGSLEFRAKITQRTRATSKKPSGGAATRTSNVTKTGRKLGADASGGRRRARLEPRDHRHVALKSMIDAASCLSRGTARRRADLALAPPYLEIVPQKFARKERAPAAGA